MFLKDAERSRLSSDELFNRRKNWTPPPENNNFFNGLLNTVVGGVTGFLAGGPIGALTGAGSGLAKSINAGNADPNGRVPFDPLGNATEGYAAGMIPEALTKSRATTEAISVADKAAGLSPKLNVGGFDPKDILTTAKGYQSGNMIGTVAAIGENENSQKKAFQESKKLSSEIQKGDLELAKTAQEVADTSGIPRTITLSDGSTATFNQSDKAKNALVKQGLDLKKVQAEIEKIKRDNPKSSKIQELTANGYLDYVKAIQAQYPDLTAAEVMDKARATLEYGAPGLIPKNIGSPPPKKVVPKKVEPIKPKSILQKVSGVTSEMFGGSSPKYTGENYKTQKGYLKIYEQNGVRGVMQNGVFNPVAGL